MNVQEMLTEIRRFHSLGVDGEREYLHIGTGTLDHWADTLERHLTTKPDGRADRGEANVIQSAQIEQLKQLVANAIANNTSLPGRGVLWALLTLAESVHELQRLSTKRNSSEPTG